MTLRHWKMAGSRARGKGWWAVGGGVFVFISSGRLTPASFSISAILIHSHTGRPSMRSNKRHLIIKKSLSGDHKQHQPSRFIRFFRFSVHCSFLPPNSYLIYNQTFVSEAVNVIYFLSNELKWTGYRLNHYRGMRQVARVKQKKSFQGVVSQGEKTCMHSDKKKRSNSTRHWLWNPIQLSTTQLKKRNRVTLEGRAANVSVAKQWQTAGRQRCLAGLVKTARLHTAMQSKRTTKSWAVRQGGVSSKLKQPGRGLFKSIRQTAGKCANKQPSADNPPPAQPPTTSSSSSSAFGLKEDIRTNKYTGFFFNKWGIINASTMTSCKLHPIIKFGIGDELKSGAETIMSITTLIRD